MEKVEIGVIGAGRIGRVHLNNIAMRLPQACVRWVCDLRLESDADMRAYVAARVGRECRLTTRYQDVLGDAAVRAVLVLTSTNAHVEICLAAIAAKKHVFCEKPVAMLVEETRAIAAAVREAGVLFQVGFNRRFDHNFARIERVVRSGRLGRLTVVHVVSRDPTYDMGYIRRSIEEGGMFVDMTIHDFDMAQFIAGRDDPVVEVMAWGASLVAPEIGALGDVDTAVLMLRTKSGVVATIDNTRKAPYGYDQRVEALGSEGCISCDNDRPTTCRLMLADTQTETDRIQWWFMERYPEAFVAEIAQWLSLVKDAAAGAQGLQPPVTCDDMIRAMLVANAANESLRTHLPVKVPQL